MVHEGIRYSNAPDAGEMPRYRADALGGIRILTDCAVSVAVANVRIETLRLRVEGGPGTRRSAAKARPRFRNISMALSCATVDQVVCGLARGSVKGARA